VKTPELSITELIALAEEHGCTANALAEPLKISVRTLRRRFERQFGIRLSRWLTELRLEIVAKEVEAGAPLKEAARKAGFNSASHLSHFVQIHKHLTATQLPDCAAPRVRRQSYRSHR
jgi:AraC-like DNA-binding protein